MERRYTNQKEMMETRKKKDAEKLMEQKMEFDKNNPTYVEQPKIKSEFYVDQPAYHSYREIKDEKKRKARADIGLEENFRDIKDAAFDPNLAFQQNPLARTKTQLEEQRKQENFAQLKK